MKKTMAIAGVVLGLMAGGANATLSSRAGGTLVYDDVTNLTWFKDWTSSGFTGTWVEALTWVDGLTAGGDWRLPSYDSPIDEFSRMISGNGLTLSGSNLVDGSSNVWFTGVTTGEYWYRTVENAGTFTSYVFTFDNGPQAYGMDQTEALYAVAVRFGDFSANVPIPGTVALLGLGLVGIGAARRKQA
jgi:hypothetical protein